MATDRKNPSILFRRAELADTLEISQLITSVIESLKYYNDLARADEIKKYSKDELLNLLEDQNVGFFVAIRSTDRKILGTIIGREEDRIAWLNWFIVSPEARRVGIGEGLLQTFKEWSRGRNLPKIWCDSRTENFASASVLMRNGFSIFARANKHWFGQDFYLWECFI